ncbi:hypothetical protein [Rhizobium sp.]|uniref:hypothetical protein n=1 Tax=Rhizobium sp. TaxID=391 RepID=UPI00389985AA
MHAANIRKLKTIGKAITDRRSGQKPDSEAPFFQLQGNNENAGGFDYAIGKVEPSTAISRGQIHRTAGIRLLRKEMS